MMIQRYTPDNAAQPVTLPDSVASAPPPGAPSAHMGGTWTPSAPQNMQEDAGVREALRGVTLGRADVMDGVWRPAAEVQGDVASEGAPAATPAATPADSGRPIVVKWEVPMEASDGFAEAEVLRAGPKRSLGRIFRVRNTDEGYALGAFTSGGEARGALQAPISVVDEDGARTWATSQIQGGWAGE